MLWSTSLLQIVHEKLYIRLIASFESVLAGDMVG